MTRAAEDWSGRRLHFVGVGGAGMSGLALIARTLGASVSGSDRAESGYLAELRAAGVQPAIGPHTAANVPDGAEVVYSSAVPVDNPERLAGRDGAGELHRSQLLAQLAALKRCLAVTGTHGKTTTTGMVVEVLQGCGMDPAYVVGGELRASGLNAAWGTGEWIVVEADESDRSLLILEPEIAVLTNAELDHHATYGSRLELEQTFAEFLSRARVAVVWNRAELLALAAGAGSVVGYDADDPVLTPAGAALHWRPPGVSGVRPVAAGGSPAAAGGAAAGGAAAGGAVAAAVGGSLTVQLAVPGLHNAVNAAGALTAAVLAGADPAQAVAAISGFQGARRRLERLGTSPSGASVYDDYAHHPTEVAAALAAARTLDPERLLVVFQPHLFSRTRALARELGLALAGADVCGVVDVYPARERPEDFPGIDGHLVAAAAADAAGGRQVAWMPTLDAARAWLESTLRDGDLLVVMGAGDIDSLGRALVA